MITLVSCEIKFKPAYTSTYNPADIYNYGSFSLQKFLILN